MVWLICQTAFKKGKSKLLIRGVPGVEWVFCPAARGIKNDKVSLQNCQRCARFIRIEQTFVPHSRTDRLSLMPKRKNQLHVMKPSWTKRKTNPPTPRSLAPTLSFVKEKQPVVDVFDEEDYLLVLAQLPGMDKQDVKVKADENTVTIKAENAVKEYLETVKLPSYVRKGTVKFTYKNNILQAKLKKK